MKKIIAKTMSKLLDKSATNFESFETEKLWVGTLPAPKKKEK
ncbi:hypothetical protein [Paenibacillus chitinolyticus]